MISGRSVFTALAAVIAVAIPLAWKAAIAAPAHVALVIGNGSYANLPPVPGCLQSAHAVSAALRGAGFDVVEREDVTSGGTDAAIAETGRRLADAPGAAAVVYVCTYAIAFNDRPFLLPVSANITRPADVLTQGVLAKSLLDMLTRGGVQSAVLALDVAPAPGAPAALGLDALAKSALPDGTGAIAVSQAKPPETPTPLAAALVAGLKAQAVLVAPLLDSIRQQLDGNKAVTIALLHVPTASSYLVGAAPPPAAAQPAPAAAVPTPGLPADEQMTEADRRRVQTALARLGYYGGQVDGLFGPDTRAAIRRYQHEVGTAMSGRLTADEATRLVNGR